MELRILNQLTPER